MLAWEVQRGELAHQFHRRFVVGASRFLGRHESTEMPALAVYGDAANPPLSGWPHVMHSPVSRFIVLVWRGIVQVLRLRGEAKVTFPVVQPVVSLPTLVDVVNENVIGGVNDHSVHEDVFRAGTVALFPRARGVFSARKMPLVLKNALRILGINNGELSLRQGNQNGIIGLHLDLLSRVPCRGRSQRRPASLCLPILAQTGT
jgi:hypothetical protein